MSAASYFVNHNTSEEKTLIFRPKLFSSENKRDLAGYKTIYMHNNERSNSGPIFASQAAEAAWNICDIIKKVAEKAQTEADLSEVSKRIKDNLNEVVLLHAKDFEMRKAELLDWIKRRTKIASTTARRLRKAD